MISFFQKHYRAVIWFMIFTFIASLIPTLFRRIPLNFYIHMNKINKAPLADRMRPHSFDQFIWSRKASRPRRHIAKMLSSGQLFSFILWGPPGVG